MLRQVTYTSLAENQPLTSRELAELLAESRERNQRHSITGVLVYVSGRFLQCIEGPHEAITQLMKNIENDVRHRSVTILKDKTVSQQSFPDWSMGFRTLSVDAIKFIDGYMDINLEENLLAIKELDEDVFNSMKPFLPST